MKSCCWIVAFFVGSIAVASADVAKGEFGAQKPDAPTATASAKKSGSEKKRNTYPFHGTLASVDSSGKTLTLSGKKKPRVILVTGDTQVFRNGARATLNAGLAGERVTGTVEKNEAGQEVAATVRYGGPASTRK
jgi:hypothetical protein